MKPKLKFFLPEHLTTEQEKYIARISDQLVGAGWSQGLVTEWWQTAAGELNGFCPLEAVAADKGSLAQLSCDKTLRAYEKRINQEAKND